jgi:hypothetical protein
MDIRFSGGLKKSEHDPRWRIAPCGSLGDPRALQREGQPHHAVAHTAAVTRAIVLPVLPPALIGALFPDAAGFS